MQWVEHMRYLGADRVFWLDFAMENPLLLKEVRPLPPSLLLTPSCTPRLL